MTAWYLSPAALAIIARIPAKPPVEWREHTYVLTTDKFAEFVGPDADALRALFSAEFERTPNGSALFEAGTAEDVIGALFGDCYGNEQFRTHRDESERWARIRGDVAGALAVRRAA